MGREERSNHRNCGAAHAAGGQAELDGVTYAVQRKRYAGPVGVKAVQEPMLAEIIMTAWSGWWHQESNVSGRIFSNASPRLTKSDGPIFRKKV